MALRYSYNPETCRYEPIAVKPREFFKKIFRFWGISLLTGVVGLMFYNYHFPLADENNLIKENQQLKGEWQVINSQLKTTSDQLALVEGNDDNNFRVILGMEPLSPAQREAGVGGREKASTEIKDPLIRSTLDISEKIKNRITVESQSLTALKNQLATNQKHWAARPAIQPIDNKQLTQLYLTFGERLHPLLGYSRPHNGLDFAAPFKTPIYATGDGVVVYAEGGTTYGNVVFVDHGFGFETRYAHMSKYVVTVGEKVKRGQVLGYVGNTGLSFGNHLHYEVLYRDKFVNPINFFQRDLNNLEYEKLISLASKSNLLMD